MAPFDDQEDPLLTLAEAFGRREVTEEQAAKNRARGRGPRKPRPAVRGEVPMSISAYWDGVKKKIYPAPLKIGSRKCLLRRSTVRAMAKPASR